MNGQGSPISRLAPLDTGWLARILLGFVTLFLCAGPIDSSALAKPTDMRLRIYWGGQQHTAWRGRISLTGGSFSHVISLGLEEDQPGSYVNLGQEILVNSKSPHRFEAMEVTVTGDDEDVLSLELAGDGQAVPSVVEVPLSRLAVDVQSMALDESGNRLHIYRAPGDRLRVLFARDSLVFAPAERWPLTVAPYRTGFKAGASLRVRMSIQSLDKKDGDVVDFWNANEDKFWSFDGTSRVLEDGSITPLTNVDVRVPDQEGVYELSLELAPRRSLNVPFSQPGSSMRRKIQFVVVDTLASVSTGGTSSLVTEFDPADPRWIDRLMQLPQWNLLPRKRQGPWSNKPADVWSDAGKSWTRLPEEGWMAYSLPVADVGMSHVLDVELPAHVAQHVGISILEANVRGELSPIGLDSGVIVGDADLELLDHSEVESRKHRLVFWPSTSAPVLLITNRQAEGTVSFGRVRLEAFAGGLPSAAPAKPSTRRRIASFRRPYLVENFLAPKTADGERNTIEDWNTFFTAGRRLVEYLRYAGYDGASVAVAAEGSALYPAGKLDPNPKYDHGIYFSSGQDARRKDVLELLFRLFDREGLTLIPSIEFATPLPELEYALAQPPDRTRGISLENNSGVKRDPGTPEWSDIPLYNPADPRVQHAMLAVVDEVLSRYAVHDAFGGLQLNLHPHGFTQFPDAEWGLDPVTLARFAATTEKTLDKKLRDELAREIELHRQGAAHQETPLLSQWLAWRAARLAEFYQRIGKQVRAKSDRPLLLSTVSLTESAPWQRYLRPALPRRARLDEAMLDLGFSDTAGSWASLVLPRPHRLAPLSDLAVQATNLELTSSVEVDQVFSSAAKFASAQYFYEPQQLRLESFDQQGPFSRAYTLLLTHFKRSGLKARQPYAHGLAMRDDQLILDGGDMLVMGQEEALRPFFDVFRQLPDQRFQTVKFEHAAPVVVRTHADHTETIAYFVNDSPWECSLTVGWEAPADCLVDSLGSHILTEQRLENGISYGQLSLEPYGLAAFRFSSPTVALKACRAKLPAGVVEQMARQVDEMASRVDRVKQPVPVKLLQDPGFETPLDDAQAGWSTLPSTSGVVALDRSVRAMGRSSVRLESSGDVVAVTSNEFGNLATGRLTLSLFLRTDEPETPPVVVARIQSADGAYRASGPIRRPIGSEFREFKLAVKDVPTDAESRLTLSFELQGAGRVWIDEVRIFDEGQRLQQSFATAEQNELSEILQGAYTQHEAGDMGGCYRTLSGFWPRFLMRNVPAVEAPRVATRSVVPEPAPARKKPSMADRLKRLVPRSWF